jgi:hypothetical protein
MDPYLEDRSLWPDVHQRLITYISEALQPAIRPKYVARIGERIEVAALHKGYIPDVLIVEPPRNPVPLVAAGGPLVTDVPLAFEFLDEERHVPFIEIVYRETGDVVTVIEIWSPANKIGDGREQYLRKQADLLATHTNLVEIDLLGSGRPTSLARTADITSPADWRYTVSISRAHRRRLEIYAFALKDRLPRCRIPLCAADADVGLDLPAIFTRCYEIGSYDLMIDYIQEPRVTLREAEATWVKTHLTEQGLRTS